MFNAYLDDVMKAARHGDREVFLDQRLVLLKYFETNDEMSDELRRLYESCLDTALFSVNVLSMRKDKLVEAEEIYKKIIMQQGQES